MKEKEFFPENKPEAKNNSEILKNARAYFKNRGKIRE